MRGFQKAQLDAAVADVPGNVRRQIEAEAIAGQKVVMPLPYWSKVRFRGVRSGAGPFLYTVSATDRRAFQYGIGQDASAAGFAPGTIATAAETNLLKGGESLGNADVFIYGLAVEIVPSANLDPDLAAAVFSKCWLELSLNGQDSTKIGTPGMFPGAGGLYGQAGSKIRQPAISQAGPEDLGVGPNVGFLSNGNPMAGNFYRIPQPFVWRAIGKGRDSNLAIILRLGADLTFAADDRAAGAQPSTAIAEAATAPTEIELDLRLRLVSVSVGDRSINQ